MAKRTNLRLMTVVILVISTFSASANVDFIHDTATLSERRHSLAATTVDNKALFAGGWSGKYSDIVDIYDAETGDWSTATLSKPRSHLAAVTVGNKAMFAGGLDRIGYALSTVDIYDADTGLWSTAALSQPRYSLAATTVEGKAFFAGGGFGYSSASDVVDIYDAETDAWSATKLSQARHTLAATTVGNKAIFAGGKPGGMFMDNLSDVVDIYDAGTGMWKTAHLSQPRFLLSAVTVGNKAMFAGGLTNGWGNSDVVDVYELNTGLWSTMTLSEARECENATAVDSIGLFAGGRYEGYGSARSDVVDIYDNYTGLWSTMTLSQGRHLMAATTVGNKAIFAGGYGPGHQNYSNVVDIYTLIKPALSVSVDIRPNNCPNPLNVKSQGVLPVAVLGSEDFDVTTIDVASIRLADVAPIRSNYEDVATPVMDGDECECTTDGPDGYLDLTLKFKTQDIVEELVNTYGCLTNGETLELTLTGALYDGNFIEGVDCVRIVGNWKPPPLFVDDDAHGNNDGTSWTDAYNNIQDAIDFALDCDTIIVADGTYTGPGNRDIDFLGKAITVRSESGPNNCIIDCQSLGRGFYFHSSEDANSVLTGFTIINGYSWAGGGIYCSNGSPMISNCTISNNTARDWGGGLCCWQYADVSMINCLVSNNRALLTGAEGISCFLGSLAITNCTIVDNTGWGLHIRHSSVTIDNSIVWDNIFKWISRVTINYSDLKSSHKGEGNISADPCFVEAGYWDENGVWVEGDYHLLRTSPCIDAGADAGVYTDIEGNIRPFDFPGVDNNGDLPEFDMGAYELVPVEAAMKFTPQTLNCSSKGKWVKAHLTLPEEFLPEDVDVNESAIAEPIGIESEYIKVLGAGASPVRLEICFDREAFCAQITETGEVEITVIGSLTTSRYFYATDTIKIKPRR